MNLNSFDEPDTSTAFYLFGPVDERISKRFCKWLDNISALSPMPVQVFINSPGGDVTDMLAMMNAMERSEHHIITIGTGLAASAAFTLLVNGDTRTAYPDAQLMYHELSSMSYGKHHELAAGQKMVDRLHELLENKILNAAPKKMHKKIKKTLFTKTDVWITPADLLELGLLDSVPGVSLVEPKELKVESDEKEILSKEAPQQLGQIIRLKAGRKATLRKTW